MSGGGTPFAMFLPTWPICLDLVEGLSRQYQGLWCGTLSNALAKSIIITSVCLPPLRLARIATEG